MPNKPSAEKRRIQNAKIRLRNRGRAISARRMIKALENAPDKATAQQMLPKVVSVLDQLAKRHLIHRNKAANQKSRLTRLVSAMA